MKLVDILLPVPFCCSLRAWPTKPPFLSVALPVVQKPSLSVVGHPQTLFYFDFLKMYHSQCLRINAYKFQHIWRKRMVSLNGDIYMYLLVLKLVLGVDMPL